MIDFNSAMYQVLYCKITVSQYYLLLEVVLLVLIIFSTKLISPDKIGLGVTE